MTACLIALAMGLHAAGDAAPAPETDRMTHRSERIRTAFNSLNKDTMDGLDAFYDPAVVFEDPLGRMEGLDTLKAYYAKMYRTVTEIRFDFTDEVVQGDTHVVMWTMRLKAKGLNKGEEVTATGNSLIRFNERDLVAFHRDYFDMGEFIYQHVPVLRFFVRKVNAALAHK